MLFLLVWSVLTALPSDLLKPLLLARGEATRRET
jgi:hypothetical protein